jgi:hypothetical protein
LLVPPVTPPGGLKLRGEFVEDVVFPENVHHFGAAAFSSIKFWQALLKSLSQKAEVINYVRVERAESGAQCARA